MNGADLPAAERLRLQALMATPPLEVPAEGPFDALARCASLACGTPLALICLADFTGLRVKAAVGLPASTRWTRELSLCDQAMLGEGTLEVCDAHQDPRFAGDPRVRGGDALRFYAGAPLLAPDHARLGTLCVMDRRPCQLTTAQHTLLQELARVTAWAVQAQPGLVAWPAAATAEPAPPTTSPGPAPDGDAWATASALGVDLPGALQRLGDDRELYAEMLHRLADDLEQLPGPLRAHAARGEWRQTSRRLHGLKGTASTLGFTALQQATGQAERALGAEPAALTGSLALQAAMEATLEAALGAMTQARSQVQQLSDALQRQALAASAAGGSGAPGASLSRDALQGLLGELRQCLQASDLRATDLVRQLPGLARWTASAAGQQLLQAVMQLDFAAALQGLDAVQDELLR